MLTVYLYLETLLGSMTDRLLHHVDPADESGQTTAEYALVLVAAGAIALLALTWATKSGVIGKLFDFVLDHIMGGVN